MISRVLKGATPKVVKMRQLFSVSKARPHISDVLAKYSQELTISNIMESIIPTQFSEENLRRLCLNQHFTMNNNPLRTLNKSLA